MLIFLDRFPVFLDAFNIEYIVGEFCFSVLEIVNSSRDSIHG